MSHKKQVNKTHYVFQDYMCKARWNSLWHQLDEVFNLQPKRVLEIGPGPGVFKHMATLLGHKVETFDLDPELNPDHIGSATALPFADRTYDVVCSFQMLEHLPYDEALKAFVEMVRVSSGYVVISLPDARAVWRCQLHIPRIVVFDWLIPRPSLGAREHKFDGQHYWEINKKAYPLARIIRDFSKVIPLLKTYRVKEMPYNRFFLFTDIDMTG